MSREKALAKNTIIMSIGTFLPKLTTFITLPIVTACLTQTEYGTYDLITTLVSFFLPMVTLQVQAAAFRFLIDVRGNKEQTKQIISNILAFIVPVSLLSLGVLYFALFTLPSIVRWLICLYFFLNILVLTARQIVRGLAKNMLYSISAVVESVLNMILIVVTLTYANQGINGILLSLVMATLAGLLVLLVKGQILSHVDLHLLSKPLMKQLISYSWPLVPNVLSDWVLRLSNRMVITAFLGLNATAIYAVANKIPSMLTLVQNTFTYAWQENASLAARDEDEDSYYTSMFEVMSRLLSGATAVLIALTPLLFMTLIKGDYDGAYDQMPILFLGMLFSMYASFIGGIYVAHKRTVSMGLTTMAAAVVNLVINLLLIHWMGIYAASLSTLLAYFFLSIYRMWDILKYHQIRYKLRDMLRYLLFLLLMCIISWYNTGFGNLCNMLLGFSFAAYINKTLLISMMSSLKQSLLGHKKCKWRKR